jgi:hypothetical protein
MMEYYVLTNSFSGVVVLKQRSESSEGESYVALRSSMLSSQEGRPGAEGAGVRASQVR